MAQAADGAEAAPPRATPIGAGERLPLALLLAFSVANLPLAAVNTAIAIYLPRHFATQIGISLVAVGAAFAIVRLIDVAVDLLLGLAMDRTRTRWGRYRPWLALGVPVMVLATHRLFMAPAGANVTYLIVWLLVLYLGTSIMLLSHAAWATTLAPQYNERARLFGAMAAAGVLGSLLIFMTPVAMSALGQPDADHLAAMGWFLTAAAPLAVVAALLSTRERLRPDIASHRFRLRDYWELLRNPSMARILLADFCLALGPGWLSATVLYLLIDARDFSLAQANVLLAVSISAGFFGAPLIARLAMRISKHRALMLIAVGYSLSVWAVLAVPKGSMRFALVDMFIMGFFNGGIAALLRAMTADVSDEIRLEQGKERAGLLFALTTLTAKLAGALSIFLTFNGLAKVGYDARAGAKNTQGALQGLELASIAGPTLFVLVGAACLVGYRLTAAKHADIRRALAAREAALGVT